MVGAARTERGAPRGASFLVDILSNRLPSIVSRTWWTLLCRGAFGVLFALIAWRRPGLSYRTLLLAFGAWILVDGVFGAVSEIAGRNENEHWIVMLLAALAGVTAGLVPPDRAAATSTALVFYIAVWALAKGSLEIVAAIRLRKQIDGEWRQVGAGLASITLGAILMAQPGPQTFVQFVAGYAFVFGLLLTLLAWKVRDVERKLTPRREMAAR